MNGNREQTNNFTLDGVDVNDSIDNRVGYSPNVDALEEVKVLTATPRPTTATPAAPRS